MNNLVVSAVLFALTLASSGRALSEPAEPWKALSFLEGTWEAHTQSGSASAQVNGTYTFKLELDRHVLARHSVPAGCKGPKDFDCEHGDLLYVYQEAEGQPLKAIYFDNEGHVIHYTSFITRFRHLSRLRPSSFPKHLRPDHSFDWSIS